jgi:uncharacterized membrane protein YqjE
MKNNDLQKIWKSINSKIESKSENELQRILESKSRKILNKFYFINLATIFITVGFFTFLTISVINRWDDIYYRINNLSIGIVSIIALVSELYTLKLFRNNKSAYSLKEWIEKSISYMSIELRQRISYYILPLIAIPSILSIHVYYSHDSFTDIFKDEESMYGLILGFIVGVIVGYIFINRYRKYQTKNLNYLKELYDRLCNVH